MGCLHGIGLPKREHHFCSKCCSRPGKTMTAQNGFLYNNNKNKYHCAAGLRARPFILPKRQQPKIWNRRKTHKKINLFFFLLLINSPESTWESCWPPREPGNPQGVPRDLWGTPEMTPKGAMELPGPKMIRTVHCSIQIRTLFCGPPK